MTVRLSASVRNAMLSTVNGAANAGPGAAVLRVYSGSQPANADAAPTGTLLVTFTLADPAFENPTGGVMAFDADPDITATPVASGTAGWARLLDSTGTTILDGSVGTSGDFVINTTAVVAGQDIVFASSSLTLPA